MKKVVTLVKFMKQEELVDMLTQIRNFKNPNTGRMHHGYRSNEVSLNDEWNRAKYRFNMNNLDYLDPLMNEEGGYVRYRGCSEEVLAMLRIKFGFEEEE
jgi:hypothetical protein